MEVSTDSTVQTNKMYSYLDPSNYYNYSGTVGVNVSAIIIVVVVILLFVALFVSLANSSNSSQGYQSGVSSIGIGVVVLFMLIVFFSGLNYFYGANVTSSLTQLFSSKPTIDISVNPIVPSPSASSSSSSSTGLKPSLVQQALPPQVFNIPGNYYAYEDAKSLCTAYGARLASYDEVENAYTNGAEWCSYGWSNGQMALFPTQKDTYNKLQTIKGHEHDCGRPGVNGGYMANPKLQFGVNCYGVKPKMTKEEEELMAVSGLYPKTQEDINMEKKVSYLKTKLRDILVAPFNRSAWSRY